MQEQVFEYLGRYTHRVAISNSRLVRIEDGSVAFRWKDYRHHDRQKVMMLEADEFLRRFLLHVLPDGFQRIRHYGLLGNRGRATKLVRCRRLLAAPPPPRPVLAELADPRDRARRRCACVASCSPPSISTGRGTGRLGHRQARGGAP